MLRYTYQCDWILKWKQPKISNVAQTGATKSFTKNVIIAFVLMKLLGRYTFSRYLLTYLPLAISLFSQMRLDKVHFNCKRQSHLSAAVDFDGRSRLTNSSFQKILYLAPPPPTHLPIYLPTYVSTHLPTHLPTHLRIYLACAPIDFLSSDAQRKTRFHPLLDYQLSSTPPRWPMKKTFSIWVKKNLYIIF